MQTSHKTLVIATTLALTAAAAHAATFTVVLDTGDDIVGSNANGAVWGAFDPSEEVNGITSSKTTDDGNLDGLSTQTHTMTYVGEFTDNGNALFGLEFSYDLVFEALTGDAGGPFTASYLASSVGVGVHDNTLGGANNGDDQIDAGDNEILRMTVQNVQVLNDPNNVLGGGSLSADGLVGLTIRHESSDAGTLDSGNVYNAGTTTVLASWDPEGYRDFLLFDATTSVDIKTLVNEATVQGFRAQFSTVDGGGGGDIPAPAAMPAGLILIGLIASRRRRA